MTTKPTTSKSVNVSETSNAKLKAELEVVKKTFGKEPMKELTIPKIFAKSFGSHLYIGINGAFVNVPVDGNSYEIPESFYDHAIAAMNRLT